MSVRTELEPEPDRLDFENVAVMPAGIPEADSTTGALNPPLIVPIVIVAVGFLLA